MRNEPLTFVFALLAISSLPSASFLHSARADVTLVEQGTPRATIVTGADASDQARDAAGQLQSFVKRISGATLPIISENRAVEGPRILVGRSQAITDLGINVPAGFTPQMDEEGFVIKTVGRDLGPQAASAIQTDALEQPAVLHRVPTRNVVRDR